MVWQERARNIVFLKRKHLTSTGSRDAISVCYLLFLHSLGPSLSLDLTNNHSELLTEAWQAVGTAEISRAENSNLSLSLFCDLHSLVPKWEQQMLPHCFVLTIKWENGESACHAGSTRHYVLLPLPRFLLPRQNSTASPCTYLHPLGLIPAFPRIKNISLVPLSHFLCCSLFDHNNTT